MTRLTKAAVISAAFAIGLLFIGPAWGFYVGGPYKGRVIDSETKQPLEGAVVLAVWVRWVPAFVTSVESFLDAEEALTDKDGTFAIGKKHPISLVPGATVEGPRLRIFYPGYGFFPNFHANPPLPASGAEGLLKQMEHEELTIELPRLTTREERLKVLRRAYPSIDIPPKKMPNLIRLINVERRAIGLEPAYTQ